MSVPGAFIHSVFIKVVNEDEFKALVPDPSAIEWTMHPIFLEYTRRLLKAIGGLGIVSVKCDKRSRPYRIDDIQPAVQAFIISMVIFMAAIPFNSLIIHPFVWLVIG